MEDTAVDPDYSNPDYSEVPQVNPCADLLQDQIRNELRRRMIGSFAQISDTIGKVVDIDLTDIEMPVFKIEVVMVGTRSGEVRSPGGFMVPKYNCVPVVNRNEWEDRIKKLQDNPAWQQE